MEKGRFSALLPLIFFVVVYFSSSLYLNDFYKVPVLIVFLLSLVIAFIQFPKIRFETKLKQFSIGAGDENILLMVLIFLLAGAFGQVSKDMGAIDSTINLALTYLSPRTIVAGLFVISCFISLSLGTSVGTIVALAPIAVGLNENIPDSLAISLAAVIGGAMFGDSLSFISDTTIAATRTQGVDMKAKFRENAKIVLPAAVLTFFIYLFTASSHVPALPAQKVPDFELIKIAPYLLVFTIALIGVNVIWTLIAGIGLSLLIGFYYGSFSILESIQSINGGLTSMFELSIICIIIGGIAGIIRYNGGIDFLLYQVIKRINSPKKAEIGISLLTALVNLCIANNTLSIIIVGPIAKEIAVKHNIDLSRSAGLLDTVSCFVQGIIPYGAQILAAVAITSFTVSPLEIIGYLYYPFLTGVAALLYILFRKRKENQQQKAKQGIHLSEK